VARSRSRRSTSHPTSSAGGCSGSRGVGGEASVPALLGCVPGEQHELGLIAFGLALRTHGWRIEYLGADTPLDTIRDVANTLDVDLVVVSAVTPERVGELVPELRQISHARRLAVGGAGLKVWKRLHSMPSR
jgi:methanogenic corrinoid protein MtbC1